MGLEYEGPFDELPAQEGVVHRVIPWDEVALDEGTGIVHIAPGAGAEDFELSRVHDLPVLAPIDESGRFLPGYGSSRASAPARPRELIAEALRETGLLVEAGTIVHRYPICWRCKTPLVFRVVDDWFIACDEIRQPLLDANAGGRLDAAAVLEAHGRLAPQHGRLEHLAQALLRAAATALPLRVRRAERDRLAGGARGARDRRARAAPGAAPALDRRGPDPLRVVRRGGAPDPGGRRRLARRGHRPDVDARLAEPRVDPTRVRDRRGRRADRRRPARPCVLGEVVPGRLGLRDPRADPPLVLLDQLHVDDARRPAAVPRASSPTSASTTSTGARCTSRPATRSRRTRPSSGWAPTSMRWLFCAQPPSQNINFGYGPADEVKRRLLTLWNSVGSSSPTRTSRAGGRSGGPSRGRSSRSTAGSSRARASSSRETEAAYERYWTPGADRRLRELRRRPLELVRPPLAPPLLGREPTALRRSGGRSSRPCE